MTFWAGVAVGYLLVIGFGLALGRYLADRFPRLGPGGSDAPAPVTGPKGPTHALDDCPPLGSSFDRALMPGAFAAEPARAGG